MIWYAWKSWVAIPLNRLRYDRFKLRIPLLGRLGRDVAVARFTRTLGTLTSAGLPILESLRITRDTLGNKAMMQAIDQVGHVLEGAGLAPVTVHGEVLVLEGLDDEVGDDDETLHNNFFGSEELGFLVTCKGGPMKWYSRTCGFRRGRYYFWRVLGSEVVEWSVQLATLQSLMLTTTAYYLTVTLVLLMLNTIITPWGFLMRGRGAFMREVIVFIDTDGDFLFVIINSAYLNTNAKLRAEADLFNLPPKTTVTISTYS